MHPLLATWWGLPVRSYAVAVLVAIAVAWWVRRTELRRLGFARDPRHRWLGLAAVVGAMVGAKLGMLLFEGPEDFVATVARLASLDFTGKTVVGGVIGGFVGVEIAKKRLGVTQRTGDAWAVALPLAQGIGRIGCLLDGCCPGKPTDLPWSIVVDGAARHPAQLYEAALDLTLAATLWAVRNQPRPAGDLFRLYLVGYASIRLGMEFLRSDAVPRVGPLTPVQVLCLAAMLYFGVELVRRRRAGPWATPADPA
ncbi:MAG: prolipoprotein diacylglyceryl transferase [Myxococcota bacterium]